ncbi:MAG: GlxA family transcriptional regulator [Parvularculaceae bacterium]
MTIIDYFPPMTAPRRLLFVIYEGFEFLDLAGPASVFSAANEVAGETLYELRYASSQGGMIASSAGARLETSALTSLRPLARDTVLVAGGEPQSLQIAVSDKTLRAFLQRAAKSCDRIGSVCSGAFFLAEAGLLNGRTAATHWLACEELSRRYPRVTVNKNALYVVDGPVWTSAGVTTGIDMALAMVARDHGQSLMGKVAKRLVVYACRPGNQSQFSEMLTAQLAAGDLFSKTLSWLEKNLHRSLRIEDIAESAGMSERSFYRKFTAALGMTPSQCLDMMRLEKARKLLEANQPVKTVCRSVGYKSEAAFRSSFKGKYGISPSQHAVMHAKGLTYRATSRP